MMYLRDIGGKTSVNLYDSVRANLHTNVHEQGIRRPIFSKVESNLYRDIQQGTGHWMATGNCNTVRSLVTVSQSSYAVTKNAIKDLFLASFKDEDDIGDDE